MRTDEDFMREAIRLAQLPKASVLPNPKVGALIVFKNMIVGKGFHKGPGKLHAEAAAIQNAEKNGFRKFKQASLFVTLEPCCHENKRTPPCLPKILEKKFKSVYIAHEDPNPLVSGRSIRALKKAGIKTHVGLLKEEAFRINQAFLKNQLKAETYITLKLALTFDGKMADDYGRSQWITSEKSRQRVHRLRSQADFIGVGRKTFEVDQPKLNVRLGSKTYKKKVLIFGKPKSLSRSAAARANGLENIFCLDKSLQKSSPRQLLRDFGVRHLFLEGGPQIASKFLALGLVDELHLFYGRGILGGKSQYTLGADWGLKKLSTSAIFRPETVEMLDHDIYAYGALNVYRTGRLPRKSH